MFKKPTAKIVIFLHCDFCVAKSMITYSSNRILNSLKQFFSYFISFKQKLNVNKKCVKSNFHLPNLDQAFHKMST